MHIQKEDINDKTRENYIALCSCNGKQGSQINKKTPTSSQRGVITRQQSLLNPNRRSI